MRFKPSSEIIENSNIMRFMNKYNIESYEMLLKRSMDIEWYWNVISNELEVVWFKEYTKVLDLSNGKPWAKWFVDGKCNIVYNCLDKHITNKPAYICINENKEVRIITYNELYKLVNRFANLLKRFNVKQGDTVTIYMPMIPEAIAAMFACSKLGAIHNVVFSGFGTSALTARVNDAQSKIIITADGYYRRGKYIKLLETVRSILNSCDLKHVLVYEYKSNIEKENEIVINDLLEGESDEFKPIPMNSNDPLFILYTSGTTGKPKGVIHMQGGFMVFAAQQAYYLIDLKSNDILFWPADIGWITGQTWSVYGSLLIGSTAILYDGAPDYPYPNYWFDIMRDYNVSIFGTTPTAIRLFMRYDIKDSIDTLRILATTGESINKNEWLWYLSFGKNSCPIINLSGGTEIGGAILSPLPIMALEPSTVGGPVPGVDADIFDDYGRSIKGKGYLVIKQPWPAMSRLWNDPKRYLDIYWSRFKDVWFHGDYASIDNNLWYLYGRVDDIIKVAGHRLGAAEIESIIAEMNGIKEVAAIGIPDELKGESIILYIVANDNDENKVREYIINKIGKFAMPNSIIFVDELPKTRTGKIMRRLLKARYLNDKIDDISTIENPDIINKL